MPNGSMQGEGPHRDRRRVGLVVVDPDAEVVAAPGPHLGDHVAVGRRAGAELDAHRPVAGALVAGRQPGDGVGAAERDEAAQRDAVDDRAADEVVDGAPDLAGGQLVAGDVEHALGHLVAGHVAVHAGARWPGRRSAGRRARSGPGGRGWPRPSRAATRRSRAARRRTRPTPRRRPRRPGGTRRKSAASHGSSAGMAMPRPLSLSAMAPRASDDSGTSASNSSTATMGAARSRRGTSSRSAAPSRSTPGRCNGWLVMCNVRYIGSRSSSTATSTSLSARLARTSLSPALRRVAELLLVDPEAIAFGTVASVAERAEHQHAVGRPPGRGPGLRRLRRAARRGPGRALRPAQHRRGAGAGRAGVRPGRRPARGRAAEPRGHPRRPRPGDRRRRRRPARRRRSGHLGPPQHPDRGRRPPRSPTS